MTNDVLSGPHEVSGPADPAPDAGGPTNAATAVTPPAAAPAGRTARDDGSIWLTDAELVATVERAWRERLRVYVAELRARAMKDEREIGYAEDNDPREIADEIEARFLTPAEGMP